jgi:2-polyprenyl-6-methoxyphenol hydroxylase-like FAD-dependent oxidoreductase
VGGSRTWGEKLLLTGADGVRSTVRRLVLTPVPPCAAAVMAWRSVSDSRPPGLTHLTLLMGEGCFFGLVPLGDGATHGFAGRPGHCLADPPVGRLDRLRDRFACFGGPVPAYLASLRADAQIHSTPVEWVNLER